MYQSFLENTDKIRLSAVWTLSFTPCLSLYNDLITVCIDLSKMKNLMFIKPSQAPHFRFIIGSHPACPIRLPLYNEEITVHPLLHKTIFFDRYQCTIQSSYRSPTSLKIQASHSFILKSFHYFDPLPLSTTPTVFVSILRSIPIFQVFTYCISIFTTSSKSVTSLLPLICQIPVSPGFTASLPL